MVNVTSGTPAKQSAQERVLKGGGVAEKKASERQRLGMRRQTELITKEQREDVLDRKISVCKVLEGLKCMV